ncbi:imelysin [Flavobacteriaceae bacterium F89]|uniref:Imelysin n=1 Tax=Cerina litoralis TaxID=2874477 RepID=A0AAE3EXN3_9FLAO|nr:imelysin family protein [Cerina litoralis]MCG2461602.1 imelysin [Cerina litoralis]
MKATSIQKGIFTIIATATLFSCSNNEADTVETDPNETLFTSVLTDVSSKVIVETYGELNEKANTLKTALATFASDPSEVNLNSAQQAWADTRAPWEKSEGFLYGPVDTGGIDPAIDTWPVDVNAMNSILSGTDPITPGVLQSNNEARGFHLIEYLLWGVDSDKTVDQFTARELEYLQAAAADLQNNTQTLYDGWNTGDGNYVSNFIDAGKTGSVYSSQKTALLELVGGLIAIADEVGNGKIADPLNAQGGSPQPQFEESRFSNNSKLDFADNIRSIQNVYLGQFGSFQGNGLSNIVAQENASLDMEIKASITDAINSIEAIPGTFTDAIFNNRTAVSDAQAKVLALKIVLESKLEPLISGL